MDDCHFLWQIILTTSVYHKSNSLALYAMAAQAGKVSHLLKHSRSVVKPGDMKKDLFLVKFKNPAENKNIYIVNSVFEFFLMWQPSLICSHRGLYCRNTPLFLIFFCADHFFPASLSLENILLFQRSKAKLVLKGPCTWVNHLIITQEENQAFSPLASNLLKPQPDVLFQDLTPSFIYTHIHWKINLFPKDREGLS